MSLKFAFNLAPIDHKKLKYIIVGDNPGKNEFEQNRFFIGQSGTQLRNHFKNKGLVENFDEECLIFNKTFLSTEKTNELQLVKEKIGEDTFNKTLLFSAFEIANYSNNLNLPILIFGKSKLAKGKIFHPFWSKLLELCETDKIFVFSHPSNSNFTKEWNKYRVIERDKDDVELLNYIGELNSRAI
ncbi:uracil-DNA glycosylase family protein [Salegentibacter salegens]|uniref:Uracil DNA glycosylase superfamily protein n=1 Tax=Salegentibacter salegens TaxID=143223 RepID=A0A1M7J978_9FLAO|nr:uracil-DNA glycosylase family protein [Salegentibacter salegens]PRX47310.1 uracil DNA glycosylase superfamily protein [Salegentibacter salegens]SHM49478.1 Uracil DNA glycosylase superfamily protein [Salegentibacter salegens]